MKTRLSRLCLPAAVAAMACAPAARADQFFGDDVIVDGSLCVGVDCINGENFGFDTIRLKENNLRIHFDDTSSSGSFPNVDWRIEANDTSNGGANRFSIVDSTNNKTPLYIEANTGTNTLYLDSNDRVGIGAANPAVLLHTKDGNTPALRLEQDGSAGFNSQIWDVAGNEVNFFVRDISHSSKLPFRIFPDTDGDNLVLRNGYVGVGTDNPASVLHLRDATDRPTIRMDDGSDGDDLLFTLDEDKLFIAFDGVAGAAMTVRYNGQVEVGLGDLEVRNGHNLVLAGGGGIFVNGTWMNVPDYVFAPEYDLMPLAELAAFVETNSHLPGVPSAAEINAGGLNMTEMQMTLLEKVEEQTLYILQLQAALEAQQARIDTLSAAR